MTKKSFFILLISLIANISLAFTNPDDLLIKRYPELFSRDKESLFIHLENNKTLDLKNTAPNSEAKSEASIEYSLLDYKEQSSSVVVEEKKYEEINYLLISSVDGKKITLSGLPKWNERANRFIFINGDVNQSNFYQLGFCSKNKCELQPKVTGAFTKASWINNDEFNLTKTTITKCTVNTKNKINCR